MTASHEAARLAKSFRHAIAYLITEAKRSGFERVGERLEAADRAIEEDLVDGDAAAGKKHRET